MKKNVWNIVMSLVLLNAGLGVMGLIPGFGGTGGTIGRLIGASLVLGGIGFLVFTITQLKKH